MTVLLRRPSPSLSKSCEETPFPAVFLPCGGQCGGLAGGTPSVARNGFKMNAGEKIKVEKLSLEMSAVVDKDHPHKNPLRIMLSHPA